MTVQINGTTGVTTPQVVLTNGGGTTTIIPQAAGSSTITFPVTSGTVLLQAPSGALTLTNPTGGSLVLLPAVGSTTASTIYFPATAGTNGQVLTTNGSGTTSWTTPAGAGGTPGGATTQVQYNNAGAFAGAAGFTFNGTAGITLGVAGTTGGTLVLAHGTSTFPTTVRAGNNTAAWSFTLPTGAGTSADVLMTDGSGNTYWGVSGSGSASGGNFDIGTPSGAGATTGALNLFNAGSTSGVTISSGVNTSAWTLRLPTGPGTAGQIMTTDGTGVTSWTSGNVTIGTTAIALGGTSTTLAGMTSITMTADPTSGLEVATKQYVDANIDPLNRIAPCQAATNANVAARTGLPTIDGVTLVAGSRVLLVGQTTASENGIWEAVGPAAAWIRPTDADVWSEIVAASVYVQSGGTTLGQTSWVQIAPAGGTMNTTAQSWEQQAGLNNYNAGLGINIASGNLIENTGVVVLSAGTTGLTTTVTALTGTTTLGGQLSVTNGGTGASTAAGALTNLLPTQGGNANKYLKTDGAGVVSWDSPVTPAAGVNTQVQYNNSGAFAGDANFTYAGNGVLNLGVAGTNAGNLVLAGSTSGTTTIAPAATAGNNTITLPSTSGTLVTAAAGGITTLTSSGGGVVTVKPANTANNTTWTYPNTNGTNEDVLSTDGSGNLYWKTNTGSGDAVLATGPTITSLREKQTAGTIAAGTLAIDCSAGNVLSVTLNANITTVTFTNAPTTGNAYSIILSFTGDGTARTITWPAAVRWPGGTAPSPTSATGKVDTYVLYTYDGGTNWFAFVSGQDA
jgi:fibronectin-binding autotransporter adhesin